MMISFLMTILIAPLCLSNSGPDIGKEKTDTIRESVVSSVKQYLPVENLASPVSSVYLHEMEQRGIGAPKDLSSLVPNLYIPDYGSAMTSSIYIRGFGSRIDNPVIGIYIDDVPVLNKNAYDAAFLDVRRADMLRGPQGTLYGRNSMCGVLSISTLSARDFQGVKAGVEYGSENSLDVRGSYYGVSRRDWAYGISFCTGHSDGFYYNDYKGVKCDPSDAASVRLRLQKDFSPSLSFDNTFTLSFLSQGGYPYRLYDPETSVLAPVSYNDECGYRRISMIEGARFGYSGKSFTLSSVSSLQFLYDDMRLDQDFTSASMFTLSQIQRECGITQEVILKPLSPWRCSWWNWQTGMFAFYRFNRMSAPVLFKEDGIQSLILDNANSNIPEDLGQLEIMEDEFGIGSEFGIGTYGAALYHESYFSVGRWLFTAGLRIDYEGNSMRYESRGDIHYAFVPVMTHYRPFNTVYAGKVANNYAELLPKLSAVYNIGMPSSAFGADIFAVVSRGYKSGGFNTQIFSDILQNRMMNGLMEDLGVYFEIPSDVTADNTVYYPETSTDYEAGFKFRYRTGAGFSVSGTVSAFHIDCRNQQITVFPDGKSTGRMMANAGRSRSSGLEVDFSLRMGGFRADVSYGYTNAVFSRYDDGKDDYSGKRIPYSPENTLNARVSYDFRTASGFFRGISAGTDMNGAGTVWWNAGNDLFQPFYVLFGADITFRFRWIDLYARIDNLTDEEYDVFYFRSLENSFFQRGKPLRFSVGIILEI